jgi:citrate lyase subunit beta/citryl-CoA lyase
VVASAAADLPGPVDGVQPSIGAPDLTVADATYAAGLGFGGKFCIHPNQVPAVNDAFGDTLQALEWAKRILNVAEHDITGAIQVDGEMIDRPQVERARRIVARARQALQ